jgi:hypothetical protein
MVNTWILGPIKHGQQRPGINLGRQTKFAERQFRKGNCPNDYEVIDVIVKDLNKRTASEEEGK